MKKINVIGYVPVGTYFIPSRWYRTHSGRTDFEIIPSVPRLTQIPTIGVCYTGTYAESFLFVLLIDRSQI